jgi:endonuclease/exonuclease/phosphatase family metal-dependent hydrolase
MVTFLFWNLNQKSLEGRVAKLVEKYEVDIVILAECSISPQSMIDALHRRTGRRFNSPSSKCEKIVIYTRFPEGFLDALCEGKRFTIRRLTLPGLDEILIVATHFPSKLHWSREDQVLECAVLSDEIRLAEQKAGHSRTMLVGDLNMNPFEDGVVGAKGLHGVMTRQIAAKQTRIVQEREYPFFYNPMWGRLGDETEGPPGTYYDQRSKPVCFFWNMFDQVLLRPELLPFFRNEEMKILTEDGDEPFVNQTGLLDDSIASDHLPILFRLNLRF